MYEMRYWNSSRQSVSQKRSSHSSYQVPARQGEVDLVLRTLVCDANGLKHFREVVGHKTVTRPLREESHTSGDEDSSAVSRSSDKLLPRLLGALNLHLDRFGDLSVFSRHKRAISVAFGMILDQDF